MNINGLSPCANCTKRKVGCHGTCKDYIEWKAELDAEREKRRAYKENEYRFYRSMNVRRRKD